jgi:hypothetical protein
MFYNNLRLLAYSIEPSEICLVLSRDFCSPETSRSFSVLYTTTGSLGRKYRRVSDWIAAKKRHIVFLLVSQYLRPVLDSLEQEVREGVETLERNCLRNLSRESFSLSFIHQHIDDRDQELEKLECLLLELQTVAGWICMTLQLTNSPKKWLLHPFWGWFYGCQKGFPCKERNKNLQKKKCLKKLLFC